MVRQPLDNLARTGSLTAEASAEDEIRGLLRSGMRRLDDAERRDLSLESRFDLAYNAAHGEERNAEAQRPFSGGRQGQLRRGDAECVAS